jgi:tetratricopeptide (TPR) repeat protein
LSPNSERHRILATLTEAKQLHDTDPRRAADLARRVLAANPASTEAALVLGAAARRSGDLATAQDVLTTLARAQPNAWGVFYELGMTHDLRGDNDAAAAALGRAIALNPQSARARHALAVALYKNDQPEAAMATIAPLVDADPEYPAFRSLRAAIHMQLGNAHDALSDYALLLADDPASAPLWHSRGHALKAIGAETEAVAAYRQALLLDPGFSEAWWSLANLKTSRFAAADVVAMRSAPAGDDSAWLNFALGKALEDAGDYAEAFARFARGNALRRQATPHDAAASSNLMRRTIAVFTPALMDARSGSGAPDRDPIFIVGMPRSGSTLVEQILASHSAVEGASELPDIPAIARRLATSAAAAGQTYPDCLAALPPQDFAALGREYLARTRIRRLLARPYFVDKFPGNALHIGLIHLMLPNARIIDVRRNPLACCVSLFKQAFAAGQAYSYDLEDLGRTYAEYVTLMTHFDTIMPGRVLHLSYEALVENPAAQIERLLAHCGLDFEPACLRFFETERVIRTPSAQQVRKPIFRDGLDQWRHFERWLGPLKAALGPLAEVSPAQD